MFIKLWERLRGFDHWLETQARIESIRWWGVPDSHNRELGPRWRVLFKIVRISYAANGGAQFSKTVLFPAFRFALDTGDELAIRYEPADPERVYVRSRTEGVMNVAALILMAIATAAVLIHYSLSGLTR
jgi:hypothetical protein